MSNADYEISLLGWITVDANWMAVDRYLKVGKLFCKKKDAARNYYLEAVA